MREILFRGKPLAEDYFDKWVFGDLRHGGYYIGDAEVYIANGSKGYLINQPVDPGTVGQFTGLIDKKGKQIFEGDVCRVTRPCVLAYGKITFQHGCFWFVDDGPGGMLRLCDIKMNGFEIEVIGNIHDNP